MACAPGTGSAPTTHRALLNAMAAQVTGSRLYPAPWNLCCSALTPEAVYRGLTSSRVTAATWQSSADRNARAAMLLRTTRKRGLDKRVEEVKQRGKLRRASGGERARQDRRLDATRFSTLLGACAHDPTMAIRPCSTWGRWDMIEPALMLQQFAHGPTRRCFYLRRWWRSDLGIVLEDAALHFISRDHSQLAEALIVPRLQSLGLLGSRVPSPRSHPRSASSRHAH